MGKPRRTFTREFKVEAVSTSFCSCAADDDALAIGSDAARHCGEDAGCHCLPRPRDTCGLRKRSPLSRSGRS